MCQTKLFFPRFKFFKIVVCQLGLKASRKFDWDWVENEVRILLFIPSLTILSKRLHVPFLHKLTSWQTFFFRKISFSTQTHPKLCYQLEARFFLCEVSSFSAKKLLNSLRYLRISILSSISSKTLFHIFKFEKFFLLISMEWNFCCSRHLKMMNSATWQ